MNTGGAVAEAEPKPFDEARGAYHSQSIETSRVLESQILEARFNSSPIIEVGLIDKHGQHFAVRLELDLSPVQDTEIGRIYKFGLVSIQLSIPIEVTVLIPTDGNMKAIISLPYIPR